MKSLSPTAMVGGPGGSANNGGAVDYAGRLRRARLGLAVALTPVTMAFVAFTSAFLMRQGTPIPNSPYSPHLYDSVHVSLPIALLLGNSLILFASSISMELARRGIARRTLLAPLATIPGVTLGEEREFPWLSVTAGLGMSFLGGQWLAWHTLAARGFYLASGPRSSMVYVLTAVHAVHLAEGLLALLYALATAFLRQRPIEAHCIVVDTTAWYWHYLALAWLYVFVVLAWAS